MTPFASRLAPTFLILALVTFAPRPAASQQPAQPGPNDALVGKRVITKYGTVLYVDGKRVDDEDRTKNLARGKDQQTDRVYRATHADGRWVWIVEEGGSARGWAEARYLVPLEQGVEFYTNLIRVNPASAEPYNSRGNVWYGREEYDKALADYSEAIRLDPTYATPYNGRGEVWRAKKEYDKALADYSEAIRLDPTYALAHNNHGNAWYAKGEYDKAIADYSEAVRLDPTYASACHNRGLAWQAKGEYDKAIADYNEAIRIDPADAFAYNCRGEVRRAKKEYNGALSDYNETIRLNPADAFAYNNRAWLWATAPDEKARDGKRAVESANRACKIDGWKNPTMIDTLAASYAEAGDFAAAVKWQEKALELLGKADQATIAGSRSHLELYRAGKPYRE